ncbi:long-chain-fatty-acid--CoA ligase [Mycobacteroides abscessus]|uniref:long-chain-fatty-acid--CoA ligase n=1 Tax=Mycobacteroides abscessus TaxID=36809 RepID=UPI00210658AC|nr:long-chain-fatty-acid--CoA ligase [Mycobacteroides abscessus]
MSRFTDQIYNASTVNGLTVGEPEQPRRSTWADIHRDARHVAGGLAERQIGPGCVAAVLVGCPGDVARVVQACWMRRTAVTMVQPPTPRSTRAIWLEDTARTLHAIGAEILVLAEPYTLSGDEDFPCPAVTVDELQKSSPTCPLEAVESDNALLQLTSGSTGSAKAVVVTHQNLYAGTLAVRDGMALTAVDCAIFWLPLFHDMGMIAMLLTPMQYGVETIGITPTDFMRDPLLWLELISRHRGTVTAGPNFSFGLVARRLAGLPDGAYDLSSLRFAAIGAEPINPATIDEFVTQGIRHGLNPTAMVPSYGLAEATLVVTLARGTGTVTDEPLPAVPEDRDPPRRYVRLGWPVTGLEMRVVSDSGEPVTARIVGEVEIRGEAVTACYVTGKGELPTQHGDGWLATGDLGYLTEDGQLVICGRSKDTIIIAGRNFYPTDIERICERVADVRPNNVVAIKLDTASGEGFAIVAESHRVQDVQANRTIRLQIATLLQRELGITPKNIVVLPPNTIPKTTSGKLRRTESRTLLSTSF